ncbi:hypothetical protein OIO90_003390 [Microbotryomycetes sp. JL221]|nr:hypothetical protein OIO90_003390 [Microbotryomycetes sp. JL221]
MVEPGATRTSTRVRRQAVPVPYEPPKRWRKSSSSSKPIDHRVGVEPTHNVGEDDQGTIEQRTKSNKRNSKSTKTAAVESAKTTRKSRIVVHSSDGRTSDNDNVDSSRQPRSKPEAKLKRKGLVEQNQDDPIYEPVSFTFDDEVAMSDASLPPLPPLPSLPSSPRPVVLVPSSKHEPQQQAKRKKATTSYEKQPSDEQQARHETTEIVTAQLGSQPAENQGEPRIKRSRLVVPRAATRRARSSVTANKSHCSSRNDRDDLENEHKFDAAPLPRKKDKGKGRVIGSELNELDEPATQPRETSRRSQVAEPLDKTGWRKLSRLSKVQVRTIMEDSFKEVASELNPIEKTQLLTEMWQCYIDVDDRLSELLVPPFDNSLGMPLSTKGEVDLPTLERLKESVAKQRHSLAPSPSSLSVALDGRALQHRPRQVQK